MWVKYLIYAVLARFQIRGNLRVFRQICIPKISELTKKCLFFCLPNPLSLAALFLGVPTTSLAKKNSVVVVVCSSCCSQSLSIGISGASPFGLVVLLREDIQI